jgi:GxxExxY protein
MEVHRIIGGGFQEYIYQRALTKELKEKGLTFLEEYEMKIYYKGEMMELRRADLLVEKLIVIELKVVTTIEPVHLAQALNYLEASEFNIGLLVNFGGKSLEFKRLESKSKSFQSNPY